MRPCYAGLVALFLAGAASSGAQDARAALRVETRGRELVIEYGPLALPASASHTETPQPPPLMFAVPVDGWIRGYLVELVDESGRRLPSGLLHHLNVIAKDRRDLFSNVMLRVAAAGPETEAITLPRLLGMRVQRGDTLVMALMLHNATETAYAHVRVRVRAPFTPARSRIGAIAVYPISIAIGPKDRPNVFDLPPGRSERYWEGSPATAVRILGVSGHLHRYGVALRFEDRTAGKVLWEVRPRSDSTGNVVAMPVKLFLWSAGKLIRPDHVYRLTAIYDNPEPRTIPDGGMGVLGGIVMLSRGSRWPAVDPRHPDYVGDLHTTLEAPNWGAHCRGATGGHC
jgi:hypothetical protein